VAYIQKNIWAPLGMTRSYTGLTPYHLQSDRGHGYEVLRTAGKDSLVDVGADFDPGITIPNGGWNAPVDDVAAWAAFLLGRPHDTATRARHDGVLARATLEEMWRPVLESRQGYTAGDSVGLGFFLLEREGRRIVGHTGDQAGYRSYLYLDPAAGTAVIAVFNTTNGPRQDRAGWNRVVEAGVGLLR
jgi:CubicO group peptidase (beta-lactamase class C family)